MNGIKRIITKHIENNLFKYIVALTFFAAGVAVGVANSFGTASETAATDIRYVFESMPGAEFDTAQIVKTSFFKNLRYFLLIFVGGLSVWLVPVALSVLFTCGFSYGFTVACMTAQMGGAGFAMSFVSVIISLFVTVPICIVLAVLAVNRAVSKKHSRTVNGDFAGYIICFAVLFIVNMVVVPVDAFVVPEVIRHISASVKL